MPLQINETRLGVDVMDEDGHFVAMFWGQGRAWDLYFARLFIVCAESVEVLEAAGIRLPTKPKPVFNVPPRVAAAAFVPMDDSAETELLSAAALPDSRDEGVVE